ncbi:MAG: ABC transporter ATP-binding protein [Sphaerochaetaceae bacterium]|nr:ABC transporter ATP-binding protein [Sphaerochaetaceae bacterium]
MAKEKSLENKNAGYKFLFKYISRHKFFYLLSIVFAILSVGSFMFQYYSVYKLTILLLNGKADALIYYRPWLITLVISLVLCELFHIFSTSISHIATFKVIGEIRLEVTEKLVKVPMGYALSRPFGVLKSIIVEKVESVEPLLAHAVPELTSKTLIPIVLVVYIFSLDWRMGLASMATLPISYIFLLIMMKDYKPRFEEYTNISKNMNARAVEYINGIQVIKAFGRAKSSYKQYEDAVVLNAEYGVKWMRKVAVGTSGMMAVLPAILISVLPIGILLCINGSLTYATFILIVILSMGIFGPLMAAMNFVDGLSSANYVFSDLAEIYNYPPIKRNNKNISFKNTDIVVEDLKFSYEIRKNKDNIESEKIEVLKGISLKINPGDVTALVGPSGSGKSTIAKLIAGFWDWQEGSIYFNGVNAKDISLDTLNANIAYVSQDNFLFNESVMENIRKGNINATDKEVIEAAKASGCHEFIMNLENSYRTIVGSGGGHLSGGEKQRISIARAMLKDAEIIILDEATAYSDPENEAIVQDAVSKLIVGKSLIVIAHRLSTITDSDQIIVINNGVVENKGDHKYLMDNCELYKDMYNAHISAKDVPIIKEEK